MNQEPLTMCKLYKEHILKSKQYVGGSTRNETNAVADVQKLYKLSSNENPIGPSPKAIEAISACLPLLHEYSYQNDEKFRNVLATKHGNEFTPSQFITANSGLELIELIVRGFIDIGLECIISTPTFLAYKNISEIQGATVIDVPLTQNYFELDVEGILSAVTENTRLVFISNPNNPTGALIPKHLTDQLICNLPEHIVVVYDEVYFHYTDANADYARAADYIRLGKNVIGLHSFSKAYGLAGIRLGYAFSTPNIAAYLNKLRRPFMINTLAMEAGIAAINDDFHIGNTQKLIAAQKKYLYNQFKKLNIHFWETQANFILFRPPFNNHEFEAKMLEQGVMVRTTEVFGLRNHIRVSIGNQEANHAFIDVLSKLI